MEWLKIGVKFEEPLDIRTLTWYFTRMPSNDTVTRHCFWWRLWALYTGSWQKGPKGRHEWRNPRPVCAAPSRVKIFAVSLIVSNMFLNCVDEPRRSWTDRADAVRICPFSQPPAQLKPVRLLPSFMKDDTILLTGFSDLYLSTTDGTSPQLALLIRFYRIRKYSRANSPLLGWCVLCKNDWADYFTVTLLIGQHVGVLKLKSLFLFPFDFRQIDEPKHIPTKWFYMGRKMVRNDRCLLWQTTAGNELVMVMCKVDKI